MKILGKLERSLAARYVCQTCEKEKERRAVAHNATGYIKTPNTDERQRREQNDDGNVPA